MVTRSFGGCIPETFREGPGTVDRGTAPPKSDAPIRGCRYASFIGVKYGARGPRSVDWAYGRFESRLKLLTEGDEAMGTHAHQIYSRPGLRLIGILWFII